MTGATADALPLLHRALSYESSLRRRTEGITWSIWGLVLALIMLMYAAMGDLGDTPPWWINALWVPWILVGSVLTWALWRTAALSLGAHERGPAGAWVTLAWIAALVAGLSIFSLPARVPDPESLPLVAIGIAWLLAGATNLFRATDEGRRALILIGAVLCALGIALAFTLPHPDGADAVRFGLDVLRASAMALVPLAVGLWQALRG